MKGTHQGQVDFLEKSVYEIKGGILYQKKGKYEASGTKLWSWTIQLPGSVI